MDELWRTLQVGDRVRIVHMPQKFASAPDTYRLHGETQELYEHLVAESAVLTVTEIDDWDIPWIEYTCARSKGSGVIDRARAGVRSVWPTTAIGMGNAFPSIGQVAQYPDTSRS